MVDIEGSTPVNLVDTGAAVSKVAGALLGFYVNSTTAGTIVIRNGSTVAGTAVSGTITPAIGFHRFPAYLTDGCFASLGGTNIDVTFFFVAG